MSTVKGRGWCWTINNPTGLDDEGLERLLQCSDYLVYGKETGENGTYHYQGYVRFKHPVRAKRVKECLPRAHIELQRGSAKQAADYCKKDGDYIEHGEPPKGRGSATKDMWKQVIQCAESGNLDTIKEEFPHIYFLHFNRLLGFRRRSLGVMSGNLHNEWWVGATGTGKSRALWNLYPAHYPKGLNKWWDGYEDEEVVAIEEMHPEAGKYLGHYLKIWADRYPFNAEVKGSTLKKIRPKRIIVLSNYTIDECFEKVQDRDPIKRRFKVVNFYDFFNELNITD